MARTGLIHCSLLLVFMTTGAWAEPPSYANGMQVLQNRSYPEAEQLFRQAIAEQPGHFMSWHRLISTLAYQQQYMQAQKTLSLAQARFPDNVDLGVLEARLWLWQGEIKQAEQSLKQLLATSPEYRDAQHLMAQLFQQQGRDEDAIRLYQQMLTRDDDPAMRQTLDSLMSTRTLPLDKQSTTTAEPPASPPRPWRADINFETTRFRDAPIESWRNYSVSLSRPLSEGWSLAFSGREEHRFDRRDRVAGLSLYRSVSPTLSWAVHGSWTPDADFLATRKLGGDMRYRLGHDRLGGAWWVTGNLYTEWFRDNTVHTVKPGLVYYPTPTVWFSMVAILGNSHRTSPTRDGLIRADWQVTSRLQLYAGASNAHEMDSDVTIDTRSWFYGMIYRYSDTLTLRAGYGRDVLKNLYTREILSAGLTIWY
ncbi:hypothetical protein GCM10023116_30300 [Kistimonas scapharcae]|uniref:YaiO family OMP domain-containing protein n=1 Tax=Kistimonas scapharcae TaxID=1036133 RepID=A0ABP8V727_9GAMM